MSAIKDANHYRIELLTMLDEGIVDTQWLAEALVNYLSEAECEHFMNLWNLEL